MTIPKWHNYRIEFDVPDEIPGFEGIRMTPFYREEDGWTDPDSNEYYPPTFNYYSNFMAIRKDDQVNFYQSIVIPKEFFDWTPENQRHFLDMRREFLLLQFEEWRFCICTPQKACSLHGGERKFLCAS